VRAGLQRFDAMLRAADDAATRLDDDALLQRWVIREAHLKQHGGSALPDALAAIALRRGDAGTANVRTASTNDVHLAVAFDGTAPRIRGIAEATIGHWCSSGAVAVAALR
jgi:hypothetical protein